MKAFGFSLVLSNMEHALWWDSDQHKQAEAKGWGIVVSLRGGDVVRPLNGSWFGDKAGGFPTKVWRWYCPVPILPFISIAFGRFGWYAGFKTFGADDPTYLRWPTGTFSEADMVKDSLALCPTIPWRFTGNRGV